MSTPGQQIYGVMGRFADAGALLAAAHTCRSLYPRLEAYAPCPVPGLAQALGLGPDRVVPRFALAGALFGALSGFLIQSWTAVIDYPINVGGRPDFSWPAFLPITVILALLWGAVGAVLGLFLLERLPRLYHPVFNVPDFAEASRSAFYLVIRADAPGFEAQTCADRLRSLGATQIDEVAP
ncbi:MAG: DUF3341 domain-containing protein [Gammaproteobacteria bacterium]|jgi:hypothetical protein